MPPRSAPKKRSAARPGRTAARRRAWHEVLSARAPARRTSARLVLDALLLDALVTRLQVEIGQAVEFAAVAGKTTDRAATLVDALEKRIAKLDELEHVRMGATLN